MTSIIIVNFRSGDVLKDCIESMAKFEDMGALEVIIVDNASGDDSKEVIETLAKSYSNIKTVFLNEDKGFSYANNKGYEVSTGEYVVIMNPDIIFTEKVIPTLEEDISGKGLGAVCPLLIGTDGNFQRNYFQRYPTILQFIFFHSILAKLFNWSSFLMNRYLENQDVDINSDRIEYVEQIPGAFFMTSREIFEEIGRMDEGYKLFFEDVDLSYQVNKKYELGVDTRIQVTHLGGTSFKTVDNWWLYGRYTISMIYFFKKNYSGFRTKLLKVATKTNSFLIILTERLFGRKNSYRYKKHKYFLNELKKDPALQ